MFRFFNALRRISDLEERIGNLEKLVESKDLDWDEMRVRCKRMLDRARARDEHAEKTEAVVESEDSQPTPDGDGVMLGRGLSPRQKQIQQLILRRRAGV